MGNQTTSDNKLVNEGDVLREILEAIKQDTDGSYYMGLIDVLHQAVHEKKMHTISYTKLTVAAGSTLLIRIVAGANKDVHARFAWTSELKSRFKTYIGSTYTANGTPHTPFNRQTSESNNLECLVYIDPTVNVKGSQRGDDFAGANASTNRVGGAGAGIIESVINVGDDFLIEITNAGSQPSDINLIANIYERNKFE